MANQQPNPPSAPVDMNKTFGAGGFALFGGAVAKIIIRLINYAAPGFLDETTSEAIDTIAVAGLAWAGAYFIPHKS